MAKHLLTIKLHLNAIYFSIVILHLFINYKQNLQLVGLADIYSKMV